MRILFITTFHCYPPVKGYQVMLLQHLQRLTEHHSIDLVGFSNLDDKKTSKVDPVWSLCNSVKMVKLSRLRMLLNIFFGFFSSKPLQICMFNSTNMTIAVEDYLKNNSYDVVVCQMIRASQFLPSWYKGKTLLNMIDPLILSYRRSVKWQPWFMRLILSIEISRLIRYESLNLFKFDKTALISDSDILDYQKLFNGIPFEQIPYGVDAEFFKPDTSVDRIPGMIVISGNMGYAPNIEGVKFFCNEIFPLILMKEPEAHLYIVGSRPSSSVRALGNRDRVTVTGHVEDVRYYLCRAVLSVCPVRLKIGIQTKVLEALSTGTPVITTSAGNSGIGGLNDVDLLISDEPEEIANRAIGLLSGENWEKLSINGRKFVQKNFQWEKSAKQFEAVIKSL